MKLQKNTYTILIDGKRVTKQTDNWYLRFVDHRGTRRRIAGFTSKIVTEALGVHIERLISCKRSGISIDPQLAEWLEQMPDAIRNKLAEWGLLDKRQQEAGRPLLDHLADYREFMKAENITSQHCEALYNRVKRIIEGCGFVYYSDLSASAVQNYLSDLRKGNKNMAIQTSNLYLQSIKQFGKWLVRDGRATSEPLRFLRGLNVKLDRRHIRRALEVDELRRLLRVTAQSELVRFGLTGLARSILYRTAAETGLRSAELRSLTVGSFDLVGRTVTVLACYSKHRREDVLPLRSDTADMLKDYFAGKLPRAIAFRMPSPNKVADMFKGDLAAADIEYVDDSGRYLDFHALRHTCGSLLVASGCDPKTAQTLMRHSNIQLTMDRYAHVYRGQTAKAIECLPDLSVSDLQEKRATGTDDRLEFLDHFLTKPIYFGGLSQTLVDSKAEIVNSEKQPSEVQKPRFSAKNKENREQACGVGVCQQKGYDEYINLS